MWDTYFEGGRDHRIARPTIQHLPYYDGDYWPGEAENLLASITAEAQPVGLAGGGGGGGGAAPGWAGQVVVRGWCSVEVVLNDHWGPRSHMAALTCVIPATPADTHAQGGQAGSASGGGGGGGRSGKAAKGKRPGPATGSPTEELMRRLGDAVQGMREDFIVVHLQEPCSFCRRYMSGGLRWGAAARGMGGRGGMGAACVCLCAEWGWPRGMCGMPPSAFVLSRCFWYFRVPPPLQVLPPQPAAEGGGAHRAHL